MKPTADLIVVGTLAVVWLIAGLLADGLPMTRTAADLRRRARILSLLVGAGAAVFVAVPVMALALPGPSSAPAAVLLAAIPGLIALTAGLHRLTQIRWSAAAFATAPSAPVPPALRAAAAHPLIAAPLQVTGLAAIVGLPIAADVIVVPDSDLAAIAVVAVGVAVLAIGIRHAMRHSRYTVKVIAPLRRFRPE
ncbi:hypothetical protein [Mangrovihabitans endophyticus]|uniref:Uncharacterized protein n=1 Tax=Mangrovihabitans endophyticus TaxID=1751298 RepID=A0A8J3C149_9ACTN|nr:hypothetical protein [Mangrovihabitans endophyticus]GGK94698.1 hypothetical protein GCM10012284_30930 [Mangrovihabitans endophyticus]